MQTNCNICILSFMTCIVESLELNSGISDLIQFIAIFLSLTHLVSLTPSRKEKCKDGRQVISAGWVNMGTYVDIGCW